MKRGDCNCVRYDVCREALFDGNDVGDRDDLLEHCEQNVAVEANIIVRYVEAPMVDDFLVPATREIYGSAS